MIAARLVSLLIFHLRSSLHLFVLAAFSLATAVDNKGCSVRACRQPFPRPHLQHIPDRLGCVHTPVQIFLFCAFAIYAERGLPV